MRAISLDEYGPAVKALIEAGRIEGRPLGMKVGTPALAHHAALAALDDSTVAPKPHRKSRMPHDAECVKSALWLLFDYFEESHNLCQNIATPSGSYWHAILHRREPDEPNAVYWFRRVGEHPIFPELLADAREFIGTSDHAELTHLAAGSTWDAPLFAWICCSKPHVATEKICAEIQAREWELLFENNYTKAFLS